MTVPSTATSYRISIFVLLVTGVCCACSRTPVRGSAQQNGPTQSPQQPSSSVKLELNHEERGTTADISILENDLLRIFGERKSRHVLERTVYVTAEGSLKVYEVSKVIEAIGKAGGDVKVYVPSGEMDKNDKPNALMLFVKIGNIEYPTAGIDPQTRTTKPAIVNGIEVRSYIEDAFSHSELQDVPAGMIVMELPHSGEFLINGNAVPKDRLANEVRQRIGRPAESDSQFIRVYIAPDATYNSLVEVANAADKAGARGLILYGLKP